MIRVLNTVFHTDGWGNRRVVLDSGVHEENEETLRQVALGNAVHTEEPVTVAAEPAPAPVEAAAEPAPAAEAEPAPAPKGKKSTAAA